MSLRASRREGVCSSEGAYNGERVGHSNEGVVGRKAECVPTKGKIYEVPHARVKEEFVGKIGQSGWKDYKLNQINDRKSTNSQFGRLYL